MARLPIRSIACAAAILGHVLALSSIAAAQQQTPPMEAAPGTKSAPGTPPTKAPAVKPSEAPISGTESLVGLDVFSSDGTRVGEVRAVSTGPDGGVVALHVRTGGFLGFGGRTVAIPQGRFSRTGQSVRLDLNSDQVTSLPEVKQ